MRSEHSAGGLVVRRLSGVWQFIAITPRGRDGITALPKGHLDGLESEQEAALREVREETGLRVSADVKLDDITYTFTAPDGEKVSKKVAFFLLKWESGSPIPQEEEIEDAYWVDLEEAPERLTYPGERAIALKASEILAGRQRA